jgi:hypothetical protein
MAIKKKPIYISREQKLKTTVNRGDFQTFFKKAADLPIQMFSTMEIDCDINVFCSRLRRLADHSLAELKSPSIDELSTSYRYGVKILLRFFP